MGERQRAWIGELVVAMPPVQRAVGDHAEYPAGRQERRDLLEILEDRYGSRSTIITSQLPPAQWHDYLGEATFADAICDRLLHNAHRIVLKGPSRRKEAKLDD